MTVTNGDVIRVSTNISLPDLVIAQNIYYYQLEDLVPDTPTNAQIVAAIDTKLTAMYNDIAAEMVDDATVLDAAIDRVEWDVDHWAVVETIGIATLAIAGQDSTHDMLPHGCAAVVTVNTSRPQTRGRKFLAAIEETAVLDSTLGGTLLSAVTDFLTEWLTAALVTGSAYLEPAVLGQTGPSAGLIYQLVSGSVNSLSGYQRRRKPGVGS